jgi:hypothetical protein
MKLLMLKVESANVNKDREDTVKAITILGFREMAAKLGKIEVFSYTTISQHYAQSRYLIPSG